MCTNKVPCSAPDGTVVYRPCGKCMDCLRQYQQDWTCRLSEEFKAWCPNSVIFFTLTYSDEMLPVMATFNHPISQSQYQLVFRKSSSDLFNSHFAKLGLDSFFYYRDLAGVTHKFISDKKCLHSSYLDIPVLERPAILVPTVHYDDVNQWIRYCRKYFARNVMPYSYRDKICNPYLKDVSWKNIHGVESLYPSSAYSPSFKYWITSEYGPQTLRPHYHGVLMGVSEEMFRDVFAPYWREHFGSGSLRSIEWSVYDPAKGGALYISKYCCKGSFEHPLCTKAIHYPSGKEFISKEYIHCLKDFDSEYPLCTPSFRLMSKGIGIRYSFNADVQKYYEIQCDEFTNFVCKDTESLVVSTRCRDEIIKYSALLTPFYHDEVYDKVVQDQVADFCIPYHFTRISDRNTNRLFGISDVYVDPSLSADDIFFFQNKYFNKKYVRSYYFKGKTQMYSCLLPRYYRRFLLSPFSQAALSSAIRSKSESLFAGEREFVRQNRRANNEEIALCEIERSKRIVLRSRQKKNAMRFSKFYSRIFVGDAMYDG